MAAAAPLSQPPHPESMLHLHSSAASPPLTGEFYIEFLTFGLLTLELVLRVGGYASQAHF